ncbi:hypothetical protein HanHA300_Chr10g0383091 [Helianthus annuus]|nr:hypothetical protein HanHA300_Chr10g0383091 [Helianthus annuus]KAJ0531859.1 hypothetical protein HanHA89_Chr10g0405551 [Helianthus annuus]KAJ0698734.1 hypothetical protein HanLR1_Chr10g0383091 [Helianthus annuus]
MERLGEMSFRWHPFLSLIPKSEPLRLVFWPTNQVMSLYCHRGSLGTLGWDRFLQENFWLQDMYFLAHRFTAKVVILMFVDLGPMIILWTKSCVHQQSYLVNAKADLFRAGKMPNYKASTHLGVLLTVAHLYEKLQLGYTMFGYTFMMLLGLGQASQCIYMAAKSWLHQSYVWTCIVWFSAGNGYGLFGWTVSCLKVHSELQVQTQGDWVYRGNLVKNKADLSEPDHMFMIYRVWGIYFDSTSLDSEVGMMYLADYVKWFWHRACYLCMYCSQLKAQGWDLKAQVNQLLLDKMKARYSGLRSKLLLMVKLKARLWQLGFEGMMTVHAQCWASMLSCMGWNGLGYDLFLEAVVHLCEMLVKTTLWVLLFFSGLGSRTKTMHLCTLGFVNWAIIISLTVGLYCCHLGPRYMRDGKARFGMVNLWQSRMATKGHDCTAWNWDQKRTCMENPCGSSRYWSPYSYWHVCKSTYKSWLGSIGRVNSGNARFLCIPKCGKMISYFWSPKHVSGIVRGYAPLKV